MGLMPEGYSLAFQDFTNIQADLHTFFLKPRLEKSTKTMIKICHRRVLRVLNLLRQWNDLLNNCEYL